MTEKFCFCEKKSHGSRKGLTQSQTIQAKIIFAFSRTRLKPPQKNYLWKENAFMQQGTLVNKIYRFAIELKEINNMNILLTLFNENFL